MKKYTEDDLKKAIELAQQNTYDNWGRELCPKYTLEQIIQSFQLEFPPDELKSKLDALDKGKLTENDWTDKRKENKRYKVFDGSRSSHDCCFSYTIVDTKVNHDSVCECLYLEHANTICDALNKLEQLKTNNL